MPKHCKGVEVRMRLTAERTGIISYAGLDRDMLIAAALRAFERSDEPVPERFSLLLPVFPAELIVNMDFIGSRQDNKSSVSPQGFSTDAAEYHRKLWEEYPELYRDGNYRRNFNFEGKLIGRGAMIVDAAWAERFPQYKPFMGERLRVYMIGGGHQAAAVPESLYPRGGGLLRSIETELRITARCSHYAAYMKRRLAAGDKYDAERFEADYLRINELVPVLIGQGELEQVMQDMSMARSLKSEQAARSVFTENARRAVNIPQYVPFRHACDRFAEEPLTRATSRLVQLLFEEDDTGDMWLPYQDVSEYIERGAADAAELCKGFQIAPQGDAETGGGRYPTRVRMASVRGGELRMLVADTVNNFAYGSGIGPLGMANRVVYLPNSRELISSGVLCAEEADFVCENGAVTPEDYRGMRSLAVLQELKGRLIDAMYRRESTLSRMQRGTSAYERAVEILDGRVDKHSEVVEKYAAAFGGTQRSGYDDDIDCLREMALSREAQAPLEIDPQRIQSIESGYAMRGGFKSAVIGSIDIAPDEKPVSAEREDTHEKPVNQAEKASERAARRSVPKQPQWQQKPKIVKIAPSHPPRTGYTPVDIRSTSAAKQTPEEKRAEQIRKRVLGMSSIAPQNGRNDSNARSAMANAASRSGSSEEYQTVNPNGSMAMLINRNKNRY